jgi:hypothetical protein
MSELAILHSSTQAYSGSVRFGNDTFRTFQEKSERSKQVYNPSNSMPDAKELDAYYKTLTDQELLKFRANGGFTEEAEQTLGKELARRNPTSDEAKRCFAPEWLDKAEVGTVGVLALESGERFTAEVVRLDTEEDRLSVKVISPDSPSRNDHRNHRAIPLHRIISFAPQPHLLACTLSPNVDDLPVRDCGQHTAIPCSDK